MRDLRAWIKFVLSLANRPGLAFSWHWYFINLVIKATNYAWCWNHHDWQRQCQWLLAGQLRQVLLGDFWDGQQLSISLNHTSVSSSTHILITTLIICQWSFPGLDTPSIVVNFGWPRGTYFYILRATCAKDKDDKSSKFWFWKCVSFFGFWELYMNLSGNASPALVILKSCIKWFECSEKRMTAHYGHGQTYKF